jgi:tripartite-type tricarboxylate transporter receptor subunit TctC
MARLPKRGIVAALTILTVQSVSSARGDTDFFAGKTITILVGAGAGGGYDTSTRIFARHLSRHLPGNPNVVPKNMPGAGGLNLANFLYNVAPKDGTTLGVFAASIALEPVFGNSKANYDTQKFGWIGSLVRDTPSCAVWKGAGQSIETLDDLVKAKKTVNFGSTAPSATTSQHAMLMKRYFGAPIKVIYGFRGTNDVKLALQRGELSATCGMLESTVKGAFRDEHASGDLKIFVQFGPDHAVPFFGSATRIYDRLKSEKDRPLFDVIFKQAALARPFAAPPDLPADRIALLRKAMEDTLKDPQLIADAAKLNINFDYVSGEETQRIFASYGSVPQSVIKSALELIGPE